MVSVPGKVECLDGVTIKMAALGCDHSIAVTGLDWITLLAYIYRFSFSLCTCIFSSIVVL